MKICFMGTPTFASKPLLKLIENGYNISHVYTRIPKPKGRHKTLQYSPVYEIAKNHNINIVTPKTLKNIQNQEEFIQHNFDLCIVASYGLILPKAVLEAPKHGCLNLHASILPQYRGASPIQMAIKNGDTKTGITVMKMDEGLDTGDILEIHEIPIANDDTFTTLFDKLANLAEKIIIPTVEKIKNQQFTPQKQDDNQATLAPIIAKTDGELDFSKTATQLCNQIRAYEQFPGSYFTYNEEKFKVIKAQSIDCENKDYKEGEIISNDPLHISCKDSILEIQTIQRQGKKPLNTKEFSKGFTFDVKHIL